MRVVNSRFEGNVEESFVDLAGATINSVAQGVLGLGYKFFQVWLSESQSSTAASLEGREASGV